MPTTTLTYTAAQGQRMAAAFGKYLGLGRNATEAEIKAWLIRQVRTIVLSQERAAAEAQVTLADFGDIA